MVGVTGITPHVPVLRPMGQRYALFNFAPGKIVNLIHGSILSSNPKKEKSLPV